MRLKLSGILTSSINTGIRIRRSTPSDASVKTQSEDADLLDQITMMHFAESIASSITLSKIFPGGMKRSHHTDQPRDWRPLASSSTIDLSSLE